jgi:hypothetical protein
MVFLSVILSGVEETQFCSSYLEANSKKFRTSLEMTNLSCW